MREEIVGMFVGGLMSEMKSHPWTTSIAVTAAGLALLAYGTRAPADDVQTVKATLATIEISLLEKAILDARSAQCRATSKLFSTARLSELQLEYFRRTGRDFRVPACEEI